MSTRSPNCAVFAAIRVLQVTSVYYPELQYGGPPLKIHLLSRELRNIPRTSGNVPAARQ